MSNGIKQKALQYAKNKAKTTDAVTLGEFVIELLDDAQKINGKVQQQIDGADLIPAEVLMDEILIFLGVANVKSGWNPFQP
jgi:hypothetical protein